MGIFCFQPVAKAFRLEMTDESKKDPELAKQDPGMAVEGNISEIRIM
jgi:hypothetical protein